MKPKAIIVAIAALLLVPAGLDAQNIGFQVGIAFSGYGQVMPFGGGINAGYLSYGGFNNPYGNPRGVYNNQPYLHVHNVPRGGFITPRRPFAPTATVLRAGSGLIVGRPDGPFGLRFIPRHQPLTPTHPTLAPVIIVTTGRNPTFRTNHPTAYVPGPAVTVPSVRIIGTRGNRNRRSGTVVTTGGGVRIGSTRADVLAFYGNPTVSMANRHAEALVFGTTTITIQNGVVIQMTGR